ncbi:DUF6383 domain-containing protein [Parabacteroides sp.]
MNRKFTQMACRLLLVAAVFLFLSPHLQAQGSDKWNGSVAAGFAGGNGDENDPYQISSGAELAYLAQQVNGGSNYSGKYFVLMNDIDLDNQEWTPIGDNYGYFKGIFDGNKKIIKNLTMNRSGTVGLFGIIAEATIQKLGVIIGSAGIIGTSDAGGLVGMAQWGGTTRIEDCFVSGGSIMSNGGTSAGGIVGYNNSTTLIISRCYVGVSSITAYYMSNHNTASAASIVGLHSSNSLTVEHCLSFTGIITVHLDQDESGMTIARIVGTTSVNNITYTDNYSIANTSCIEIDYTGKTTISIPEGAKNDKNGANLTRDNFNGETGGAFAGWETAGWIVNDGCFPKLREDLPDIPADEFFIAGSGTVNDPYQVNDESDFLYFAYNINQNTSGFNGSEYFKLANDISLASVWNPIGTTDYPFKGTFDGDGHTVTLGISVKNKLAQAGLFGTINTGATVQKMAVNVVTDGITSTATGAPSSAGAIAAVNKGTIKQCYVTGDGTVLSADGSDSYAGGIAGDNSGTISDCYNLASVKVEKGSNVYAGGIAGHNTGTVEHCFAAGEVSTNAGSVVNSLSIPAEAVGGIVGFNDNENAGVVKNCLAVNSFLSLEGHRVIGTGGDTDDVNNFAYNDMPRPMTKSADVYDPLEGTPLTTGNLNSETGGCFNGWNTSVWDLNSFTTLPKLQGFTSQPEKAMAPYLLHSITIAPFSNGTLSITRQDLLSGLITVNNNDLVSYNTELTITATPDADYELKALTVNGIDFSSGSVYTVNSGITVKAEFSKKGTDPDPTPTPDPSPTPPTVYYTVTLPAVEGVTTDPSAGDYEVEAWSSFRFYLTLNKDYDLSEPVVTTDRGETIAPQSSDGAYIVKYVRSDVQISIDGIVKNPDPVANETIEATSPKVRAENGSLHIQAVAAGKVYVYTTEGKLQTARKLEAGEAYSVYLPAGVYLVVIGNERFKVVI